MGQKPDFIHLSADRFFGFDQKEFVTISLMEGFLTTF